MVCGLEWVGRQYVPAMLAVLPDYRGQGIGYQLKLAQREKALSGIKTMTRTYDPTEAANAYLNIHRLGGVVRHYYVNHYGEMPDKLSRNTLRSSFAGVVFDSKRFGLFWRRDFHRFPERRGKFFSSSIPLTGRSLAV